MSDLHVVVGAGAPGVSTARLLAEQGDRVRLVTRSGRDPGEAAIEPVALDATDGDALTRVTEGAATLFNCAMPSYDAWPTDWPPLADAMLVAAERTGARYVMLGNPYGYGPVEGPIDEGRPFAPTTIKGAVRARIWTEASAAHRAGRVLAADVRPSDFIGPGAASMFTLFVAPSLLAGEVATVPMDLDAPHTWSYTTDVARTLVAVARDEGAFGRPWHVPSPPAIGLRELSGRFARAAGAPEPRLERMEPATLHAAAAGDPLMRELPEMQYMYLRPFELDSSAAERTFAIRPTDLDEALRQTAAGFRD